jgi:hypothetical protein
MLLRRLFASSAMECKPLTNPAGRGETSAETRPLPQKRQLKTSGFLVIGGERQWTFQQTAIRIQFSEKEVVPIFIVPEVAERRTEAPALLIGFLDVFTLAFAVAAQPATVGIILNTSITMRFTLFSRPSHGSWSVLASRETPKPGEFVN